MGKSQRAKGAAAEREVANILKARGHDARREGQMQAGWGGTKGDPDVSGLPGCHIEVKRQETLRLDEWTAQAERDASAGLHPVLIYRQSRQPWRVRLRLASLCDLAGWQAHAIGAHAFVQGTGGPHVTLDLDHLLDIMEAIT